MDGQVTGTSHIDSQPLLWMTVDRSVLEKPEKMTWCSEWTLCLEKFLKKFDLTFSSRNQIEKGVGSEEMDALEQRRFQDGVDLSLGAIEAD